MAHISVTITLICLNLTANDCSYQADQTLSQDLGDTDYCSWCKSGLAGLYRFAYISVSTKANILLMLFTFTCKHKLMKYTHVKSIHSHDSITIYILSVKCVGN